MGQSARSQVTTVASRTLDRAQAYAAEWTIPRALGSYDALLKDPDVDVIYIALPNSLHVEWTVRSLAAGKHVLCEKPLALSVEGVDRIQAGAISASRVAAEAFMYRHHPLTHAADAVVSGGGAGPGRALSGGVPFSGARGRQGPPRPGLCR